MADKMMRIAGRGVDGLAKPVSVDVDGKINANAKINALDVSGNIVDLTAVQNPITGKWYLGTADVAPVAYNEISQRTKTENRNEKKIMLLDLSKTTTVASTSGHTTFTISPPIGEIWHIRDIYFLRGAIQEATSGTHKLIIVQSNHWTHGEKIALTTAHNKAIGINKNLAGSAVDTVDPVERVFQKSIIENLKAQNGVDTQISFIYYNNSNASITEGAFVCKIWYEREFVV